MVSLRSTASLNPRQEQFVSLVASGLPAGRAYEQAGYKSRGNAADAGASKLLRNAKVTEALERERRASREASRLTRDEKLGILEAIARDSDAPARERITSIKVHNDMTGEAEAITHVKFSNANLDSVKARAMEMEAGLIRRYRPQDSPE